MGTLNTVLSGRVFISTGAHNVAGVSFLDRMGWTPAGQISGLLPLDEAELFFHQYMWPATLQPPGDRRR